MRFGKLLGLLFLLGCLMAGGKALAQTNCSYTIISLGTYTQVEVDQAFANAKLDAYRFKTLRRTMRFTNGAEVELFSASELQSMGCQVDGLLAMEDTTPLDPARRFEIHASGYIIEPVQAVYKH